MPVPVKIYVDTITEFHRLNNLPDPKDPVLSVLRFEDLSWKPEDLSTSVVRNFYIIALKKNTNTKFTYGQEEINFDEGVLHFMSPKQVITIETPVEEVTNSGWLLLIHPDFLWNTSLAKKIKQYEYFSYKVNEALALSLKEETTVVSIIENIYQECHNSIIDKSSKDIILAQIELLLAYSERFYQRQFISGRKSNHRILAQLELLINEYFKSGDLIKRGIPTIRYISDELHISPNYLSRLLQVNTGQSTKSILHDKLIELAKEKLSTTELSISEIAYELGFKSPQSFSKLFKIKNSQTPLEFRQSFNR